MQPAIQFSRVQYIEEQTTSEILGSTTFCPAEVRAKMWQVESVEVVSEEYPEQ